MKRAPPAPDTLAAEGPGDPAAGGPWDALVLGGGAAGLWAAGTAARRGRRVLLLEKNPRVGVKVLASGGGACNLTTTLGPREAARWFGRAGERFLAPAFRALPPAALREAFEALGVPTEVEEALEKVWPVSRRAHDVAAALLRRAREAGARVRTATPVTALLREAAGWRVHTPHGSTTAPHVLLAVGGRSYARTGTTGDGYAWLAAAGHTVTPLAPALVPLVVEVGWVRELAGIALEAGVQVLDAAGRVLLERRRPLLFTHTGLSGPAAMDASRWFSLPPPAGGPPRLLLDLLPGLSHEALRERLERALAAGGTLAAALPDVLPARLRRALCQVAGAGPDLPAAGVSREVRHALVQALKRLELPVAGTRGWDHAEVTAGGVALDEVDPGTLASRVAPGLFVAGELLDLDGPIGGFSFQAAFATGELAGRHL
ncbi:MAG: NAD(P)/FAD-dependent oxidoreductase [Planctomycetia bacterium]